MAWPVDIDEENNSSESLEANVSSSTDHNASQNVNERTHPRALVYQENLLDVRELRVSNPFINRVRNARRYSTGDVRLTNTQRASASNQIAVGQRHSVPCCHINPSVFHSCCLHLNRNMSVDSSNSRRRNSFPQNRIQGSYNTNSSIGYNVDRSAIRPHTQFSAYENRTASLLRVNAEYERECLFSISRSILFWNENFQVDRFFLEAVSAMGPEFFMRFLANEMDQRGLQLPSDMCSDMDQSAEVPHSFIYLMERFSVSRKREMIFGIAMRVEFPVSYSSFIAVIDGMNEGTDSAERRITSLFFCADLAIRAFCDGHDTLFREIVSWTIWYFRNSNSLVVVTSKKSPYKIALAAWLVGMITVLVLIKRN